MQTPDLQRAEVLRPRIADFIADATGPELAGRLDWIGLNGSAVEKLLYFELAAKRQDLFAQTRLSLEKLIDPKTAATAAKAAATAAGLRRAAAKLAVNSSRLLMELDGRQAASDLQRIRDYGGKM